MKSSVPEYIQNPLLPITITVIGAGGNGTMFCQHLAHIVYAYQELYARRIVVTVMDGDAVSAANVGRQAYGMNELFQNKAQIIVSKINRVYGFEWLANPKHFTYPKTHEEKKNLAGEICSNFIVTAVDNVHTREELYNFITWWRMRNKQPEYNPFFWVDMGNTKTTGNVVVESVEMGWSSPLIEYADYYPKGKERNEPSCSLAQALNEQSMFVNKYCATIAAQWLWECLTSLTIEWRGAFYNTDTLTIRKLKVNATKERNSDTKPKIKSKRQSAGTAVRTRTTQKRKNKDRAGSRTR